MKRKNSDKLQRQAVHPEERAARSTARSTSAATSGPFLVIVLDEREETTFEVIVEAESYRAAEHEAVARLKDEHDFSDIDDLNAGFKPVASYSQKYLMNILREMKMPEPDYSREHKMDIVSKMRMP